MSANTKQVTITSNAEDLGKLVLRLTLGLLILLHGIAKLQSGVDPIIGMVSGVGLPGALGYLVYVGEVLAPILVIIGLWTRPAALVVLGNMLVAVGLVHMHELFKLGEQGGWALELQGMFIGAAIAVALLGAGRYSVGGATGKWN